MNPVPISLSIHRGPVLRRWEDARIALCLWCLYCLLTGFALGAAAL